MVEPSSLTDAELRAELQNYGYNAGPITGSTRNTLETKLTNLRGEASGTAPKKKATPRRPSPKKVVQEKGTPTRSPGRPRSTSRSSTKNSAGDATEFTVSPATHSPASSSPRSVKSPFRRKPTPTRPSLHKSREFDLDNVFLSNVEQENRQPDFSQAEDEEFDHMESSRLLAPRERHQFGFVPPKKESPMDTIKRFGSSAVGYLTSSGQKQRNFKQLPERNTGGKPGGHFSLLHHKSEHREQSPGISSDIPKLILICFASFTSILALAYIFTAHGKTVVKTQMVLKGVLKDTLDFVYTYAILPVTVASILVGVVGAFIFFYRSNKQKKLDFEKRTMNLVDRIADRVRAAGADGIAEQEIRDLIFPPTRRQDGDWKLWKAAADFINETDSRIRSESQLINGVECGVWIWVTANRPEGGWQGSAIANGTPSKGFDKALTRCLKLRYLDDGVCGLDDLKRDVMAKLRPTEPIHYEVVRGPGEPAVYMAFANRDEATLAYNTFHSQWYNGNLIQVKYMYEERYRSRFPDISLG